MFYLRSLLKSFTPLITRPTIFTNTLRTNFKVQRIKIPSYLLSNYRQFSTNSENNDDSSGSIKTSLSKDRYIAVFTCNICNLRSAKSFSKAYNHGIVYVRCEGCKSLHLISDQLGWFGDKQNIEEILLEKGQEVSKMELGEDVSSEDLSLIEDLKDNKYFKE